MRIDHVGVTVSDLERSLEFYCGILGMRLLSRSRLDSPDDAALHGVDSVDLSIADLDSGDGQVLELIQYHAPEGGRVGRRNWDAGSIHIALTVDDLESTQRRAREAGADVISRRALVISDPGGSWDGVTCLYIRDPDGALLELVQRPS